MWHVPRSNWMRRESTGAHFTLKLANSGMTSVGRARFKSPLAHHGVRQVTSGLGLCPAASSVLLTTEATHNALTVDLTADGCHIDLSCGGCLSTAMESGQSFGPHLLVAYGSGSGGEVLVPGPRVGTARETGPGVSICIAVVPAVVAGDLEKVEGQDRWLSHRREATGYRGL